MATAHESDRTLVDAALAFAADGWRVFPCHSETKKPLTTHGFHDASDRKSTRLNSSHVLRSRMPSSA